MRILKAQSWTTVRSDARPGDFMFDCLGCGSSEMVMDCQCLSDLMSHGVTFSGIHSKCVERIPATPKPTLVRADAALGGAS